MLSHEVVLQRIADRSPAVRHGGLEFTGFRYLPRKAACCRAIQDDELREEVANKFRADMFRGSVLPKYMQKLRA